MLVMTVDAPPRLVTVSMTRFRSSKSGPLPMDIPSEIKFRLSLTPESRHDFKFRKNALVPTTAALD